MSGWIIERWIGETRAARIVDGRIAEMRIDREGDGVAAGEVWAARLVRKLGNRRGIVRLGDEEAIVEPLPDTLNEGALARVEVVRAAIPERGRPKLAKVRAVEGDVPAPGRLMATPPLAGRESPVRKRALDAAGWAEAMAEAASGVMAFPGGTLTLSPTPAMTLLDVDGDLDPVPLAEAGARAAAAAILKFDIGGSIGIDLPTVRERGPRLALGGIFDAELPPPFERTAVNGFGFIQIVRPRLRPSIIERSQLEPVATAAIALLNAAEVDSGIGPRALVAAPAVIQWIEARPHLVQSLGAALGVAVSLRPDPSLAIAGGYVHARQA